MFPQTIFEYITTEESRFDTDKIQMGTNWQWNMKEFVQMVFHLKHGVFFSGENDWMRSFKNIMEPVLSLAKWTEDIELKDVTFFSESKNGRVVSFFFKKFHDEVYSKKYDLDELFDEITESDVTYGGTLVDITAKERPTVLALTKVAFCDQTDILGGPIAVKMYLSPSKLKKMTKNGWFNPKNGADGSAEELVLLASQDKSPEGGKQGTQKNTVTGKAIEVYILRGDLPESYLKEGGDDENFIPQLQIVAFYTTKKNKRQGFTIYKKESTEDSLTYFTSAKVEGRGLGFGWGEKMLHPQIWTNFFEIHKTQMLQSGAKTPIITDDETFTNRNKIQDMENLEVAIVKEGRTMKLLDTVSPNNVSLYQNAINTWFEYAQYAGAAFDPMMGKEATSGTTFRGQNQIVQQGKGPHDRLRGKRAKFIEYLYRVRILKDIKREILNGKKFLATLTGEEMEWVSKELAVKEWNKYVLEKTLADGNFEEGEMEAYIQMKTDEFREKGSQHILEVLKGEFDDVEVTMGINVAGKQKDLSAMSDKILSIIQFAMANPQGFEQVMKMPSMADNMDSILEYSGVSPSSFYSLTKKMKELPQQPSPMQPALQPANVQPA
jgi:hypothetical protein